MNWCIFCIPYLCPFELHSTQNRIQKKTKWATRIMHLNCSLMQTLFVSFASSHFSYHHLNLNYRLSRHQAGYWMHISKFYCIGWKNNALVSCNRTKYFWVQILKKMKLHELFVVCNLGSHFYAQKNKDKWKIFVS